MGVAVFLLALLGPFLAPYSPTESVGIPYTPPTDGFPLGTDALGRDVFSRVLWGGRTLIGLAVLSTAIAYAIGASIGLVAGYSKGRLDAVLMRSGDVLLSFPPMLILLLLASGLGPGPVVIIAGVSLSNVPSAARIVRTATLETSVRGYVEAAVARGEKAPAVITREIVPNITTTLVADAGVRFTYAFLAIASLNFLGLGLQPPFADWATMIAENRTGINLQPWAVAAPAVLIALFTISVNVVGDAIARGRGTTSDA